MRHAMTAVLLAWVAMLVPHRAHGQADAAKGESAERTASRMERDRLWDETRKRRAAGKTAEAFAAAEAMLALDRRRLGSDNAEIAESLGWLAELQAEREDFAAARASRGEALEVLQKLLGDGHWKAADARRALEDVDRLAGMGPERRRKLAEAGTLNGKVESLYQAGKSREALPLARQVLAIIKEVLGERHPDYAQILNNLAGLLREQGDLAAARPLFERALAGRKEALGERHPAYDGH
jgi:tetratricopeptide (TPR) repeat protein